MQIQIGLQVEKAALGALYFSAIRFERFVSQILTSNSGLSLQESIIVLHIMLSCSFECVEYIESMQK